MEFVIPAFISSHLDYCSSLPSPWVVQHSYKMLLQSSLPAPPSFSSSHHTSADLTALAPESNSKLRLSSLGVCMTRHPLLHTSPGLSGVDQDLGSSLKTKRDRALGLGLGCVSPRSLCNTLPSCVQSMSSFFFISFLLNLCFFHIFQKM